MTLETNKGLDGRRLCLQSDSLANVSPTAHVGLWIDKFLPHQEKGAGQRKADHFEQAVRPVDRLYDDFFKRWKQSLEGAGAQTHKATVQGRLAIGLGGESVLETSISLHRTYGVPYIPGSALKGLAAHYACNRLKDWGAETYAYKILFGNIETAGYVTFYDALYVPDSANYGTFKNTPLALDVINVHHPDYYRGEKNAPPADWDSPTPVSFLSATGRYLLALGGPQEWVETAFKILSAALKEEGIGAKTSSGYGRMEITDLIRKQPVSTQEISAPSTVASKSLAPGYRRGVVKTFGLGESQSYGYIESPGVNDVFVHRNNLAEGLKDLQRGQKVVFRIITDKGKMKATDVRLDN